MTTNRPTRRTQRERRESTMAAAVDAAITTIAEVGYSRASMREICARAGMSQGTVTRHFPTRLDLIAAVADEVASRQAEQFAANFAAAPADAPPFEVALTLLRDGTRAPLNAVWLELVTAARTTPELAARLRPLISNAYQLTLQIAALIPASEAIDPAAYEALVLSLVHLFNGEALSRTVVPMPAVEERRLALVASMLACLTQEPAAGDQRASL